MWGVNCEAFIPADFPTTTTSTTTTTHSVSTCLGTDVLDDGREVNAMHVGGFTYVIQNYNFDYQECDYEGTSCTAEDAESCGVNVGDSNVICQSSVHVFQSSVYQKDCCFQKLENPYFLHAPICFDSQTDANYYFDSSEPGIDVPSCEDATPQVEVTNRLSGPVKVWGMNCSTFEPSTRRSRLRREDTLQPTTTTTPLITTGPPCAQYTQAIMSTGAVIRGNSMEDLAGKTLQYSQQMSNHQRCSTIGCPGHQSVVLVNGAYRCGAADTYVEDNGWWEWHFHPEVPLVLNGLHVNDQNHASLPWQPIGIDISMTSPEIQQGKLQITEGVCVSRNGTGITFDPCDDFLQDQDWLFIRLGAHFRLEVPNNPYLCVVMPAANATAILLPCPPCMYGSSAPEVSMNVYGDDMPSLTVTGPVPSNKFVRIPLTTDPTALTALTVNTETGLCECATQVLVPVYTCECSLENYRRIDVFAQLGDDGCSNAAGSLLAACERLGAGLAAVDGTKIAMKTICALLGQGAAEVTGTDGYGGSVACVDDMVQVVTMGGNYQPSEPLLVNVSNRMLPGLSAITSKIIFQPHSGSMPTTITAPHRTVVNATGFLAVFGNNLYRITTQGFSTGGVVWAGVIVELVVCTVAVIVHCAFAATSPSRVAQVKEKITRDKKNS